MKSDLMTPADLTAADLPAANAAGVVWRSEVNATVHFKICARSPTNASPSNGTSCSRCHR